MENENKKAAFPHELLMADLSFFHLLLPLVAVSSDYMIYVLAAGFIFSICILLWILKRAEFHCCEASPDTPLIKAHWQKAWNRSKFLLMGYAISAAIMLLGWFIASSQSDANMVGILLAVFSWIAAVPLILIVFAIFVLSTISIARAKQGTLPKTSKWS